MTSEQLLENSDRWRLELAEMIVRRLGPIGETALNRTVQRSLLHTAFLDICSRRGIVGGVEMLRKLDVGEPVTSGTAADLPEFAMGDGSDRPPADLLGILHQRALAHPLRRDGSRVEIASGRSARRGQGVYYTPPFVVDYIVRHTLEPLTGSPKIIDPACGAGVFLTRAYAYLAAQHIGRPESGVGPAENPACTAPPDLNAADRARIVRRHLFGVDRDPQAVRSARLSLALLLLGTEGEPKGSPAAIAKLVRHNIRCGDTLVGPEFTARQARDESGETPIVPFDWQAAFPEVFRRRAGGFDAVVGNPPYVNIRHITQQLGPQVKQYFRDNFTCARGNYDLYVLFIERAFDLLRSGGRFGMIVPNKLATLGYAEACRRLLLTRTTMEQVVDVTDMRIFQGAGVYPWILVSRKDPPRDPQHLVRVIAPGPAQHSLSQPLPVRPVKQSALSAQRGFLLAGHLDVESRVATAPLNELAELHSGATGFGAARLAAAMVEHAEIPAGIYFDFIVSGNIDRYRVARGNVRFMKRNYQRPMLPVGAPCLSRNKQALFRSPKIVIAGMTRRLEAAFDPGGTALGVQVYAVINPQADPYYLLAVLNSRLISRLFRQRFAAKRLGGGYLAINKGQLNQLPIRKIDFARAEDGWAHDRLVALAKRLTQLCRPPAADESQPDASTPAEIERIDAEIDMLVERLYDVRQLELAA